jgi:hypothetical protein
MDAPAMSKIQPVGNLADLQKAIGTAASLEFTVAFVGLCQKLRPTSSSAHIFLLRPETAPPVDPAILTAAARDAHVTVHAVCGTPDGEVHGICQATGGFYAVSGNVGKTLSGFYRGLSHRYLATFTPEGQVRHVQVAVHTGELSGESAMCDVSG